MYISIYINRSIHPFILEHKPSVELTTPGPMPTLTRTVRSPRMMRKPVARKVTGYRFTTNSYRLILNCSISNEAP